MRMHVSVSALVMLACGAAASAIAQTPQAVGEKVDTGWAFNVDGVVRFHNYNGRVTVIGWDRDSAAINGTIAPGGHFFGGGGRSGIKAGIEGPGSASAPLAVFTLYLPKRARVSIRGAATTIEFRDFAGTIDATTLDGDIKVRGSPTEITAETMDGDIDVAASPKFFRATTATGKIYWWGASDDVSLRTVSGDIKILEGRLAQANVESISGAIVYSGGVKPAGRVRFDSHGGDVIVSLSKDTYAVWKWTVRARDVYPASGDGKTLKVGKGGATMPDTARIDATSVPRGDKSQGTPATITATSFKGRVTITQP